MSKRDICYCIGLHHGDGSLGLNVNRRKTSKGVRVYKYWYCTFSSTDKYLVDKFKDTFKIDNRILETIDSRKESYKIYYRIHTHSNNVVDFLLSIGYCEHKKFNINYLKDFIRGYEFDFLQGLLESDGCVTNDYCEWVVEDSSLVNFISYYLESKGIKCFIYINKTLKSREGFLYVIRVRDLVSLYPYLWDYNPGYQSRKFNKYLHIIQGIVSYNTR